MTTFTASASPTKQKVRDWMQERQQSRLPLPSQEEMRRQLGFGLIPKSDDRTR